jgi:sugar phosphate permease
MTSAILSIPLFVMMFLILFYLKDKIKPEVKLEGTKSKQENYFNNLKLLLKNAQLIPLFLVAGVRTVTQNGILVFMPLYLVANQGVSAAATIGASLFTMQIGGLFSGPIAGYLSDKHGRKIIAVVALLISSLLAPLYIIIESNLMIIILSGAIGFAIYAGRPVVQGWALDIAPEKTSGSVIGLLFMVQVGSAAIFAIIAGIIADIYGLEVIFIILSFICLLTLAIASLVKYPKPTLE